MPSARVVFGNTAQSPADLTLCPGENLLTGENNFFAEFGEVTSLEQDVLNVVAAIFACDIGIKRGRNEGINRTIELTVPVVNHAAFEAIKDDLRYAIWILSRESWNITFTRRAGQPEAARDWPNLGSGKVLLFSGGLDSFAAAVSFAVSGENVQLVSHVTSNRVVYQTQERLHVHLNEAYPNQFARHAVRISGRNKDPWEFPKDDQREETQRTRSLVFLTIACLTARRRGIHDVVVIAENGQMAIHLPLSAGRIGAFSTHTAHPHFIALMASLMSRLLSFEISITNPFLYNTKKEVIAQAVTKHPQFVTQTTSCWKASRVPGEKSHCGICVPCMVRRISIESNGVQLNEYHRDLFIEAVAGLPPDDDGKRNLMDLAEFVLHFEKNRSNAEFMEVFPELINEEIDADKAIKMYKRFASEARAVFNKYPQIASIVS